MTAPGRIVIVNGTSGAGKSAACARFQQRAEGYWLIYGIDHFMANTLPARFGHHGPRADEGIRAEPVDPADPTGPLRWRFAENAMRAFGVMHEWIATASRMGADIVFDHLLLTDPPILADLARRLHGLPTLLVTLKPPYAVLERRVAERVMDKTLPVDLLGADAARLIVDRLARLRPWFYDEIYRNPVADLTIDTDQHDVDAVVAQIIARLADGPGTALATIHAQPASGA